MGILQQRQVFWNCTVPELLFLVRNCNQSWNVIRFSFEELLCCSDMRGLYFILLINYILKASVEIFTQLHLFSGQGYTSTNKFMD